MNSFDEYALCWDQEKIHLERSLAIAACLERLVPIHSSMQALEYGAGTGLLSFALKDKLSEIVLMDNSQEMIKVCHDKVSRLGLKHMHPVFYDLEQSDEYNRKFDLIYNQMVLHHIKNIELLLEKFFSLLNPGGYLAIADLYQEDGSFHGEDADVHKGFDPVELDRKLLSIGFAPSKFQTCFVIVREDSKYPLFLQVTQKL